MAEPRIVVLAGRGRYEDPWHDHAATSHRLAVLLAEVGGRPTAVDVRSTFPDALHELDDVDLLVVNSGTSWDGFREAGIGPDAGEWVPFHSRIDAWARAGGRVLAVHQAANTFDDAPGFSEVLGGRWVEGRSTHPLIGPATLELDGAHPVTQGLGGVDVFDERYCFLEVAPSSQVLGWVTDDDGVRHPALWVTEAHGGRTVYSGLGHDVRSYDSPSHREVLLRAAEWLLST